MVTLMHFGLWSNKLLLTYKINNNKKNNKRSIVHLLAVVWLMICLSPNDIRSLITFGILFIFGLTENFPVQGSESLASWQANLLFEPVQFEVNSFFWLSFGICQIHIAIFKGFCYLVLVLIVNDWKKKKTSFMLTSKLSLYQVKVLNVLSCPSV